jgi:transcriptional regulator with GAF, ATPase, and Fis domain
MHPTARCSSTKSASLPLDLQPKLLRVLENGEFQRIGETLARHSSARIVTATNRDLKKEVREGRFRADLYHRLSVFTIDIPPLRDLGDDRLLLLEHFRAIYAAQADLPPFRLSDEAAPNACWPTGFPAMYANCATSRFA